MQQPESIPQNYGRPQYPPALSDRPFNPPQGSSGYPTPAGGSQYPPRYPGSGAAAGGYGQPQQEEGIFSKMKNVFTGDGGSQQGLPPLPPRHITPPPPGAGYNRHQQGMGGPPPPLPSQQSGFQSPPRPEYGGGMSSMPPPPPSTGFGPHQPGRPFDHQQQPGTAQQQQPGHMYGQAPPPPIPMEPPAIDWQQAVPPEPQLIVHEDCVVLIFKPQEFHRKKAEMTAGGASSIQVFADFEGIFTKFRTLDNQRAVNTAELLESAEILAPDAKTQIQNVYNEEGEGNTDDYASYEDIAKKCQSIIASSAQLHIANVVPVTKSFLSSGKLVLRESWRELLQVLSIKAVPFFLFSSGYGDIVANALIGSGLPPSSTGATLNQAPGSSSPLPTNLRIISNFFRTAPDGTVRAFSQPIVHEQNKNMSTAEAFMNMPAPQRPHALLLAAHEADIAMTEGLKGKQLLLLSLIFFP